MANVNKIKAKLNHSFETLNANSEMFSLLIEAVSDYAIFALDPDGYILSWNTGARRLKGYESSEAIGMHFSQFYTEKDLLRNHPQFELTQALLNGSYQEEGWRVTKDGNQFWASVVLTALKDSHGVHIGFAKVTRDLTERKKSEDELHLAYQGLEIRVQERTAELALAKEDAEKAVASRDEFLSIASHELRTPLTSLKLQIQSRRRQVEKGDFFKFTQENFLQMVDRDEKQINRINRLIEDMLQITQITSGKVPFNTEKTDLGILVTDVLERFSLQFQESKISLLTRISPDIIGNWDRYKLEQVFINLLTNAIKYGENNPIEIDVREENSTALLVVRDFGIGIKKEDHERVFQQFERAVSASSISGLGLGLFIVNKIIESHNGSISIHSQLGVGSTFTIRLPLLSPV